MAIQPIPSPSSSSLVSLQFRKKDVVEDQVKDYTEVQINDIQSSSLANWCNHFITESHYFGQLIKQSFSFHSLYYSLYFKWEAEEGFIDLTCNLWTFCSTKLHENSLATVVLFLTCLPFQSERKLSVGLFLSSVTLQTHSITHLAPLPHLMSSRLCLIRIGKSILHLRVKEKFLKTLGQGVTAISAATEYQCSLEINCCYRFWVKRFRDRAVHITLSNYLNLELNKVLKFCKRSNLKVQRLPWLNLIEKLLDLTAISTLQGDDDYRLLNDKWGVHDILCLLLC